MLPPIKTERDEGCSGDMKPKLLHTLSTARVLKLSLGDAHLLILTTSGEVFTYGSNEYGQLGLGMQVSCAAEPQRVNYLGSDAGVIKDVAAGTAHSLALSHEVRDICKVHIPNPDVILNSLVPIVGSRDEYGLGDITERLESVLAPARKTSIHLLL